MKRGTELAVAAAAAVIALLSVLCFYVGTSSNNMKKNEVSLDSLTGYETEKQGEVRSVQEMDTAPNAGSKTTASKTGSKDARDASETEDEVDPQTAAALRAARLAALGLPEHLVIFVGDSRVVGMGKAEKDNYDTCVYIGEVGEGYDWFMEDGLSLMRDAILEHPDAPVVVNLGVNDLWNIDLYLEEYGTFRDEFPDTRFVFMSVNPVEGEELPVDNVGIGEFNAKLREAFPDNYLDSSSWLRAMEFETVDGLHYTEDSYCLIHDFAVRQLSRD